MNGLTSRIPGARQSFTGEPGLDPGQTYAFTSADAKDARKPARATSAMASSPMLTRDARLLKSAGHHARIEVL
jgi:hypothetical protein